MIWDERVIVFEYFSYINYEQPIIQPCVICKHSLGIFYFIIIIVNILKYVDRNV